MRGVHGEKIAALLVSSKLPDEDRPGVMEALSVYDDWAEEIRTAKAKTLGELITRLVASLNRYKFYVDLNLIFDSPKDFLYRQKGQLKLDNTVIEEFMSVFVRRCIEFEFGRCDVDIYPQSSIFSSIYFTSSLDRPELAGGLSIKTKDYDLSISRKIYLRSSYSPDFKPEETLTLSANLGYILAELKTNLDKTMFQEASATARDIKQVVPCAKYYLLCDYIDMTPISTATTDIDEILITRKAKRLSATIRKNYASREGRRDGRENYVQFLKQKPYCVDIFQRFAEHVITHMTSKELAEDDVLEA